jgi:hypothetical protein
MQLVGLLSFASLALCQSLNYRAWPVSCAVSAYEVDHEHEYNANRNGAVLSSRYAPVTVVIFRSGAVVKL